MDFFLKKITDYWDYGAVERISREIVYLRDNSRTDALTAINSAIEKHAHVLSKDQLTLAAYVMADGLYKAINETIIFDEAMAEYLEASAGKFCAILRENGIRIHYLIENVFHHQEDPFWKDLPFRIFQRWFRCAGFVYVCPQKIVTDLMEYDKVDSKYYFDKLPYYIEEARGIANDVLSKCHANGDHYVLLDIDHGVVDFGVSMAYAEAPGVITIHRWEPPIKGSKCAVIFPKEV